MPSHKWLMIAKNEYRIRINRIRWIKPYFPYLIIVLLAVYLGLIAPTIVNFFIDELLAFWISQIALAMIPILLFMFFIYMIILPITYTLQGMQSEQVEIFLTAPVKPSDVLLGEFLGIMPFYAIALATIAGLFTAALTPLGLDIFQIAIIVVIFVVIFLSALWIGTVLSAIIRTRFAKTARGKDIGKALSLVLALPMIAVLYAIMGGGLLDALANPATNEMVRNFLNLFPSSWGAELILSFASSPGNIAGVAFETATRFGGLLVFFVFILWLGTKVASRAYSIEPTTFSASKAKPDGLFYNMIRRIGGRKSFGTLLVSVFKDYSRRLENLSRLVYILSIILMVTIFFGGGFEDLESAMVLGLFLFPFLAVLVVGNLTSGGKETLYIYKKAPFGLGRFVNAKLIHGLLVANPIVLVTTTISAITIPQMTAISLLSYIGFMVLYVSANIVLALGLSFINPEFSENARTQMMGLMVNAQIAIFSSIGVFITSTMVFDFDISSTLFLQTAVVGILGTVFLYMGKRKLSRIE